MNKFNFYITALVVGALAISCSKKAEETTASTNIATGVVNNLAQVSAGFSPDSLATSSSYVGSGDLTVQADPCDGVTDFAVCQSNLIREYLRIGKETVDLLGTLAGQIGAALGDLPDGATGTSTDGKISYSKTSSTNWAILSRGLSNNSLAYFSVNGSIYSLKMDGNQSEDDPQPQQAEATVTFTDADNWTVDVYFSNGTCSAVDVGSPSKIHMRISKVNGLWTGKSMLYSPRWEAPGETVTCGTAAGTHEVTLYTDFVGNDTSTKAALYILPAGVNSMAGIASYDLADFCTNFASYCGGAGEPTGGALAAYPNNWCTTGPGTSPTWGDDCTANAAVSGASFSNVSNWTTPADLKVKSVTLPTSL